LTICAAISDKLERRHPHIFGDAAGTAPKCWRAGSRSKALSGRKRRSIPRWTIFRSLPALMRAHKISVAARR
jgi:ATP diphosphatase